MKVMQSNFFIAPNEALLDPELTPAEFRMLCVLYSFRGRDTNTVWPGLDKIRLRAGYTDNTQVSRMTTKLEKKGWLTKNKKTGPRGTKKYILTVPARLSTDSESQLDTSGQLDDSVHDSTPGGGSNCQLDSTSQVDCLGQRQFDTLGQGQVDRGSQPAYEQTTEQTIEQTTAVTAVSAKSARNRVAQVSLDCVPLDLIDVIEEFIDHRRNVKRPLTQNALERFLVQVHACSRELGLPPRQVVTETIDAGWQSVKPGWLKRRLATSDDPAPRAPMPGPGPSSTRQSTISDDLHDTSWAR